MRRNIEIRRKIELSIKAGAILIISVICINSHFHNNLSTSNSQKETSLDTSEELLVVSNHQINFQGLSQAEIPTGCESVSTVAILNHLGIEITPEHFIEEYLPKQKFYRANGNLYGPDPNEYFAGDPFLRSSLGCFPNVIIKALNTMQDSGYAGAQTMQYFNLSGTPLSTLAETYISNEIPILIWVTIDMKESKEGMNYLLEDGTPYTWRSNEHCVVLCGYDEEKYYIMDPLAEGEILGYPKELVEMRYKEMNQSALVITL